jgi:hypothetical protein
MNITVITDQSALPAPRRVSDALPIRQALIENPGKWVEFSDVIGVQAATIKGGIVKAFQPKGSFDAFTSKGKLLAVFLGEPEAATEEPQEAAEAVEEAPVEDKPAKAPRVRKTKAQRDAEAAQAALDAEDAPVAVATEEV